jgi:hypothetical protein
MSHLLFWLGFFVFHLWEPSLDMAGAVPSGPEYLGYLVGNGCSHKGKSLRKIKRTAWFFSRDIYFFQSGKPPPHNHMDYVVPRMKSF